MKKMTKCKWKGRKIPCNTVCWAFLHFAVLWELGYALYRISTGVTFAQQMKARWNEQSLTTWTHLNTGFTYPLPPGCVRKSSKQIQGDIWTVAGGMLCSWVCNFQPVIILCQCGRNRKYGCIVDHTDHWLLRIGTPCFNLYTSCYRWKKEMKRFMALL